MSDRSFEDDYSRRRLRAKFETHFANERRRITRNWAILLSVVSGIGAVVLVAFRVLR